MTNTEKLVLLSIADHADQDGRCWPSIRLIANKCELSERSVYRVLDRLEQYGRLKRLTSGGGRDSTRYQLTIKEEPPLNTVHPTHDKVSGHPCQDVTPPLTHGQGTPDTVSGEPSRNRQGITKEPPETGAGRALASRKKRSEPTPEARELVHLFAQAYLAHTGTTYGVREVDSKHATLLLAMSKMGGGEITDVVKRLWAGKGWWGKRTVTLKGLVDHWNEIQAEVALGPVSEVPQHVEAFRLKAKLARHPANREWIGYRAEAVTPAHREEYRALKAKLAALEDTEQ